MNRSKKYFYLLMIVVLVAGEVQLISSTLTQSLDLGLYSNQKRSTGMILALIVMSSLSGILYNIFLRVFLPDKFKLSPQLSRQSFIFVFIAKDSYEEWVGDFLELRSILESTHKSKLEIYRQLVIQLVGMMFFSLIIKIREMTFKFFKRQVDE